MAAKPWTITRTSIMAHTPDTDAKREADDSKTCSEVKAPRMKITRNIGSRKAIIPHIEAIPKSNTILTPQSRVFTYLS